MRRSITNLSLMVVVTMFMSVACSVAEIPELDTKGSLQNSLPTQQLTQQPQTQTTLSPIQADSNISISVIKDSSELDSSSIDKIIFELRNNALEIVNMSRLAEKQASCPENVKSQFKEGDLVICKSYVQKRNLTDIVVFIGTQKNEVASWVFDDSNPNLLKLKIKLK